MTSPVSSRSAYFFGSIAVYIWQCKVESSNYGSNDSTLARNDNMLKEQTEEEEYQREEQQLLNQMFLTLKANVKIPESHEEHIEETLGAVSSTTPLELNSFECAPGESKRSLFLPVLLERAHCLSYTHECKQNENSNINNNDDNDDVDKYENVNDDKDLENNTLSKLSIDLALHLQLSSMEINGNHNKNKSNNDNTNTKGVTNSNNQKSSTALTNTSFSSSCSESPWIKHYSCTSKLVELKEIDVMSENDECVLVKINICHDSVNNSKCINGTEGDTNRISSYRNNTETTEECLQHKVQENMNIICEQKSKITAEVFVVLRVINLTSIMCSFLSADRVLRNLLYSENAELLTSQVRDSATSLTNFTESFPKMEYVAYNTNNNNNNNNNNTSSSNSSSSSKSTLSYLSFGAIPLTELYRHYRLLCAVVFNKILRHSDSILKLLVNASARNKDKFAKWSKTSSNDNNNNLTNNNKKNGSANKREDANNNNVNGANENSFTQSLIRLSAETRVKRLSSLHDYKTKIEEEEEEEYEHRSKQEKESHDGLLLQTFIAFRWDTLHKISLERVMLGDHACAALLLTLSHCVNLCSFNGDGNALGDYTCARLLCLFHSHRCLSFLSLRYNRIYDTGAWLLRKLACKNTQITQIHLDDNPISASMLNRVTLACKKNQDVQVCNVFNVFTNSYNYLTSPQVLSNEIIHKATCVWSTLVARTIGEIDVWVRNATTQEFEQFVDETASERRQIAQSILQPERESTTMQNIKNKIDKKEHQEEMRTREEEQEEECELQQQEREEEEEEEEQQQQDDKEKEFKGHQTRLCDLSEHEAIPRVARAPLLNEVIRTVSNKINRTTSHPLVQMVFMDMVEALAIPTLQTDNTSNVSQQSEWQKQNEMQSHRQLAERVTSDRYYVSFVHLLITMMHGIVFEVNWDQVKKLLHLIGQYQRELGVMPEDYINAVTAFMRALHVLFATEQVNAINMHISKNDNHKLNIFNNNNNNNNNINNNIVELSDKDEIISGDYLAAFLMVLALGVRTAVQNN